MNVLASPVVFHLSHKHYARGYNLLKNIAAENVDIDAYVNHIEDGTRLSNPTLRVNTINADSRLGYYASSFETSRRRMRKGTVDLYHHMNLGYRHFNPLLIAGLQGETPTLLGPVEGGHDIPPEEFKAVVDRSLDIDLPEWASDAVYKLSDPITNHLINPSREALFARTVRNADRLVAVHEDAKAVYARYTDPDKIDVVPYGVNHDQFEYHERGASQNLVVVGNLIHRKGHENLFEALPQVLSEFPDAHLHIVGQGPKRNELETRAVRSGISDSVTFHGHVGRSELLSHLRSARAFVHPSHSEGFSHVRLEAMAAGCPVVGTDVAGAGEITRDGVDGFIVPKRSPEDISDAICTLLADERLAREMGQNAREKIERDHDYAEIGKRYVEIYQSMIE